MDEQSKAVVSFFSELRRRKVIRTCFFYVLACWGALQVVDILVPALGYDGDLASRYLFYLAVAGFPVCFALAWFYHFTSHGIVRTDSFVDRRVLSNIPPISDRRHSGVTTYFHKVDVQRYYDWIVSAETGPLSGMSFGVEDAIVFGRSLECDIAIVTPHISRQHARVFIEEEQLYVEDMGSSNGTIVNGKPTVGRQALRHEDEIRFHDIIFRVTESFSRPGRERQSMNKTTFIHVPGDDLPADVPKPEE